MSFVRSEGNVGALRPPTAPARRWRSSAPRARTGASVSGGR